jgi:hypothetical protein
MNTDKKKETADMAESEPSELLCILFDNFFLVSSVSFQVFTLFDSSQSALG